MSRVYKGVWKMKEAFTYMFKDNKYPQKALTYFCCIFLAQFAAMYARLFTPSCLHCPASSDYLLWGNISSILMILPIGYQFNCIKSLIEQKENFIIPFFNFKTSLVTGLKVTVATWVMILVWFIAGVVGVVAVGVVVGVAGGGLFVKGLGIIVLIAFFLFFLFYYTALMWIFAYKGWLTSFLRLGKAIQLVSKDVKNYVNALVLNSIVCIVCGITLVIPVINLLTAIIAAIITSAISAYTIFVTSYITAKSIKAEYAELL